MKKIIFFSKNLNIGGMEKALVNLLNSLCDDYQITLVLEEKKGSLLKKLKKNILIKEYHLSQNKIVILRKGLNYFKRMIWALKYRNKYDFACNYATYSYLGSKLAQIASNNNALYIHSNYYGYFNKDIENFKEFFNLHGVANFKHLIFVSNESKEDFLKIYPKLKEKCEVINNLIDYENIKKLSLKKVNFKINRKDKNYLFLGRLDNTSKNFPLLLDSFKEAILKNKNIKLFIIGDGFYKENILKYIKENQLKDNIIFLGEKINPYPYLKKCDVLILTSNYEGFPVVYLEALVLNKEIMTTIRVSDKYIDIKDYAIIFSKNKEDIVNKLLSYQKKKKKYSINFKKINEDIIKDIKEVVEVK